MTTPSKGRGGSREINDDDDDAGSAAEAATEDVVAEIFKFCIDDASISVVTIFRFISEIAARTWPSEGFPSSDIGMLFILRDANFGTNKF